MGKREQKARKARKSRRQAVPMERLRRILEDPDSIVWSPDSIAMNCMARSSSANAWFLRDVYSA